MAQKEKIRSYCVYKHTSPDGRVYIGLTKNDPLLRWENGHGYKNNTYFTRSIKKYGWENFKHDILYDNLTEERAKQLEIKLIAEYKSNQRKFGFNISSGGESAAGIKMSARQKELIRKRNLGKSVSKETRKKLSEASKRVWQNPDHIALMRELNLGKNNPQYGKIRTDEEKIIRGAKSVIQKTLDGEIIAEFISLHDAENKTGVHRDCITRCCKGISKQSKGFIWEYK